MTVDRTYSTGQGVIDRRTDGGIRAGTILVVVAPPDSQSEELLTMLLGARDGTYASFVAPEEELDRRVDQHTAVACLDPAVVADDPSVLSDLIDQEQFLVVDPFDPIESCGRDQSLDVIDQLKRVAREKDAAVIIHCIAQTEQTDTRRLTLKRADQVWRLQPMVLSREIKNRLVINKSRHGRSLEEPLDIVLTDGVSLDTTRNI